MKNGIYIKDFKRFQMAFWAGLSLLSGIIGLGLCLG